METVAFPLGVLDSALARVLIESPLSPFHVMSPEGRVEKEVVPKVVAKGMGCGEGWVCAERMEMPKRIHERRMRRFEAGKLGVESVLGAHLDSPTRSWMVAFAGCFCSFNAELGGVVDACIYFRVGTIGSTCFRVRHCSLRCR